MRTAVGSVGLGVNPVLKNDSISQKPKTVFPSFVPYQSFLTAVVFIRVTNFRRNYNFTHVDY